MYMCIPTFSLSSISRGRVWHWFNQIASAAIQVGLVHSRFAEVATRQIPVNSGQLETVRLKTFTAFLSLWNALTCRCSSVGPNVRPSMTHLPHRIFFAISYRKSTHKIVNSFLLLLMRILSWRFCGGVDFLKLIHEYVVSDKHVGDKA